MKPARVGLPSRWLPGEALGATAGASYACRGIGDCVRHHFTVSPTRPRVLMVHWPSTARWAIAGELCGSVDCSCSQHELAVSMGGRAEVIARAPGPGVDPPGQSGCGMRCMGAWLARGTREGVQERSAVPRSGRRVGERAS